MQDYIRCVDADTQCKASTDLDPLPLNQETPRSLGGLQPLAHHASSRSCTANGHLYIRAGRGEC